MNTIRLRSPYLLFVGDETRHTYAKTAVGLKQWRPELCVGQLRMASDAVDLGLPDMSVAEAAAQGVGSVIVGTALVGGSIPDGWRALLLAAAQAGLDVVAGLHTLLSSDPELVAAARASGARLVDVRVPPAKLPVGTGRKRNGKRLLTVGTDCALGKKYTALQLEKDLRAAGVSADFRATGQTGIMIAGHGLPLDAVVGDFMSGAAELVSPDNEAGHWDVIEGQGSIFHPGYAAVTLGLLQGSQPDAFVVCHAAGRTHIEGWPHIALKTIGEVIERTVLIGRDSNPEIRCVGISINSAGMAQEQRQRYLAELSGRYGLPCVDPLVEGTGAIVRQLLTEV